MNIIFKIIISTLFVFLLVQSLKPQSALSTNHKDSTAKWADSFFQQLESNSKIPEFDDAYGVIFRDLNGNGLADLYVVRFRNLNRLLQNRKKGRYFRERTIGSGLGGNLSPSKDSNLELGTSAVDYNNDDIPEISIAGWGKTSSLYQKQKKWNYEKIPFENKMDGNFTAWADVNNDGHLDLFITDEHDINHLFINNGFGEFENKSEKWGFNKQTISQGAAFADVNNDGWPDLYVCNWFAADHFYLNNNGEKFILQNLPISHLQESFSSNSSTFADINNDGKIDLIVCDRDGKSCIYLNQIDSGAVQPKFKKMTNCGLQNTLPAYGAIAADFNNNGYPDIYFTNIGPNKLFINRGNGNFILAKENDHLKSGQKSYYSTGAATADYDNDGDLDLFVANKDTICFLYTNPLQKTQNEKSIRIGLKSVHSNRDAIGSKIWLYEKETGEIAGYRQIQSGQGYLSTSEIVAHFGVKENIKYRLEVKFPSGIIKRKKNLQGGAFLTIHDEKGIMWDLYEGRQLILKKFHTPSFWKNFLLSSILIFAVAFFILTGHKRYKWTIRQSIFYYGGIILILYFNYIFYYKSGLTSVLYMQLSISGILMTMLLFLQERNYRTLLKRFSYRQKLLKFSQKLVTIKNKKELFEELVNTIYKNLKISFCAYYDFTLHNFLITAGDEFKNISSELSKKAEELYKDKNNDNITEFNLNKTGKFSNTVSLLLKMNENISGIMFLGPLLTGEKIKTEDLNLLEIIANQTSISMENINYIEETKELVKEITENKIRKEYIKELEEKNRKLNELYKNLQETQTQMIHQEKMAALGQLVAGVAHELNNPISFVYANMRELEQGISTINELISIVNNEISTPSTLDNFNARLKEMLSDKENLLFFEDLPQIIDESLEGSNRVKEIVKTLKNFSRIDESEFKEVNIHDGLDSTLLLIKNQLRDRIIVDKQYGNIPEIYCQPGQINQVFMNILMNASQAIKGKGTISITTEHIENTIFIKIGDSGIGIPKENINKIFEPFFTTQSVGKGTGLGLSISYSIIKNHKGKIWAENQAGGGTAFVVELPIEAKRGAKSVGHEA